MPAAAEAQLDVAVLSRAVGVEALRDADRQVLVFENGDLPVERVTAGALARHGNQVASALRAAGIGRGDRVALMTRNHPEFVYGLVADAKLGCPTVPVDPRARGDKLAYFLGFAECAALITADYVVADEQAASVIRSSCVPTWVVSTTEGRAAGVDVTRQWPTVNEMLEGPEVADAGEAVESVSEPWLLAYTSGTTGEPKAIEFGYDRMLFYRRIPELFGYVPEDVTYTGLSLTHGNALVATMMPAVWGGVRHAVFSRWFTKSRLWEVCRDFGCTTWSNLGGIATGVYSEPPSPLDRQHQVRLVVSAGMPREIWPAFEERFGVRILEWYGTMEGGFACNPPGVGPVGSFGKPPEGLLEMDVVDDDGGPVGLGEPGELLVRPAGGQARLSYFKNAEGSARKIRDGWLRTGDLATRDQEGWLYFLRRKEDSGLRRMGEFISEGFIRRALAEDPDVLDVHVYGVPSKAGAPGETDVVAAVVARDPAAFDVNALFDRAVARLERSHVPDFVQVVEDLPRTASEKVQVRFLIAGFETGGPGIHARPAALAQVTRGRTKGKT